MTRRYWVHRNNAEPAVTSKKLFNKNYLSIGWSSFAARDDVFMMLFSKDQSAIKQLVKDTYGEKHKYDSLKNFALMQPDDIVLVPALDGTQFCICRVLEPAVSVCSMEIPKFSDDNGWDIIQVEGGMLARNVRRGDPLILDIGYLMKMEKLTANMDKLEASKKLRNKLNTLGINVNADEFAEEIEKLIE